MKKRLLAIFLSIALLFSFSPAGSSYAAYSDDYSYILDKLSKLSTKDNSKLLAIVMDMVQDNYDSEISNALSKLTAAEKQLLTDNGFDNQAIEDVLLAFSQVMDPEGGYKSGYSGDSLLVIINKIKDNGADLDRYKQELVDVYEFMFDALPSEVVDQDFSEYGSRTDKARVFRDVLKAVYDEGDICARYYEANSTFKLVLPDDFISKANGALDVDGVSNPIELTDDHAGAIEAFLDVLSQKINSEGDAQDAKEIAGKLGVLEIIGVTPPPQDTTPPTDVSVSLVEKTATTVKLSLSAKDESGIAEYCIYRDGKKVGTCTSSSYTDSGLTPDTACCYKITAKDNNGNVSGFSPEITVRTDKEDTAAPTNARVSLVEKTATTVKLSLSAKDESEIARYYIYRDGKQIASTDKTTYRDEKLRPDTEYKYHIVAEDEFGNKSGPSAVLAVRTDKEDTAAPTNARVSLVEKTATTVKLSLSAKDESEIARYYIYRDGKQIASTDKTTYRDEKLRPDTEYKYHIVAEDEFGNKSEPSAVLAVRTDKEEKDNEAPTDMRVELRAVTDKSVSIALSAQDESGIKRYHIYRDGIQIKQTASAIYTDQGLKPETKYEYKMKAEDNAGNISEFSPAIIATTLKAGEEPEDNQPPINVKVALKNKSDDYVQLSLFADDESGIEKYYIFRSDKGYADGQEIGTSKSSVYKDKDLKANTTYKYKIKAEDKEGNISDLSNEFAVTTDEVSSGGGGGGGGGGGSSTGGSGDTEDKDSITQKEDKNKVEVEDKLGEDAIKKEEKEGKTEVVIDKDKLEKEIGKVVGALDDIKTENGQGKGGKIVVDLGKGNSENSQISIPVKAIEKAKGKDVEMVFRSNDIELSVHADNLAQKADSVKLEIKEIKQTQEMMDKIQKSLEPGMKAPKIAKIVSFELYKVDSGKEEKIDSSFKKKVKVQIDLSDMDVDKDNAVLVFVDDEGKMTIVGRKVVDGKIVAELEHFSYYAVVERDVELSDISGHWAKDYIYSMACKDIVCGYQDGSFRPEKSVTRAEFAKLMVEEMELEMESPSKRFSDSNGHWAEGFIETAYKNGIISGYEDGTVRPNEKITRAEMAVMISRAISEDATGKSVKFKDGEIIPNWAKSGVEKAAKLGLMKGDPNMNFNPESSTTRAQAATVIYRLFNKEA